MAQQQSLTAAEMAKALELKQVADLKHWLGRLAKWIIVRSRGRTKGTEYFVSPAMLEKLDSRGATTLRTIESHRLRELIRRDLEIHREAGIGEIHERIGPEIPRRRLREQLRLMLEAKEIAKRGEKRGTLYFLTETW